MSMIDRGHLSIGEVLNLLQDDFPDITISKIRFLESQGLLDPERTPSGYRKFYDADITRLRWILRQQREHFLPLKVIKDRLAAGEPLAGTSDDAEPHEAVEPTASGKPHDASSSEADSHPPGAPVPVPESLHPESLHPESLDPVDPNRHQDSGARAMAHEPPVDPDITLHGVPNPFRADGVPEQDDPPPPTTDHSVEEHSTVSTPTSGPVGHRATSDADAIATSGADPVFASGTDPIFASGDTTMSLTVEELVRATGLTARQIGELERFGLIQAEHYGTSNRYDEEALLVARVAASMLAKGVEVRHLRMFKLAAEREAAFYEQLVTPILKQRNPKARQDALETLRVLAAGGDALRSSMLRSALKHLVSRG